MKSPALATSRVRVLRVPGLNRQSGEEADVVAVEEPLEIRLVWGERVQRLAVTMRTPGHDADLAVGFLAGEGVVRCPADVVEAFHTPKQLQEAGWKCRGRERQAEGCGREQQAEGFGCVCAGSCTQHPICAAYRSPEGAPYVFERTAVYACAVC